MNFDFEIENTVLRQKHKGDERHENFLCFFCFKTPEWKYLEKYAIFWNDKGKSTIRYLGRNSKTSCPIPENILQSSSFILQIYANENVFTQKLDVNPHKKIHRKKRKHHEKKITKIDDITYEDNHLLIYSDNELVKKINIVDSNLLMKVITSQAPDFIIDKVLSPNSEHAIANKTIYQALLTKSNIDELSKVAFSGNYNDLDNIPETFTPKKHDHFSKDIRDFDDSIDEDLEEFIDILLEKL